MNAGDVWSIFIIAAAIAWLFIMLTLGLRAIFGGSDEATF